VIEGEAPDCLKELPAPTHAFIGGSSGRLLDIIGQIREKNAEVRFVVNAVTFETIAQMEEVKKAFPEYQNMEVVQVSVARGRELGSYHALAAENPVYIFCFGGSAEKTKVKK
jgi:precorrin-6Y C5,15-methyltransferase (decarboxylating)